MALRDCRVVLVETLYPGNLGATARVMRNFGLEELVLVAPLADKTDRRARRLATHGEDILDRAPVVSDFGEAVADCVIVAGTSARRGGLFRKQAVGFPEAIMPRLVEALQLGQKAALVFGPEDNGLANEATTRCHYVIQIPTNPAYPSLNLAQAVALCLYELSKAWHGQEPATATHAEPATFDMQERLYCQLRQALEAIHFLYGTKADALMHALRHLLGKARLSEMEVKLLLGLARQIRWFADKRQTGSKPQLGDAAAAEADD
jgi:tRNA/rRNA methyltransferase